MGADSLERSPHFAFTKAHARQRPKGSGSQVRRRRRDRSSVESVIGVAKAKTSGRRALDEHLPPMDRPVVSPAGRRGRRSGRSRPAHRRRGEHWQLFGAAHTRSSASLGCERHDPADAFQDRQAERELGLGLAQLLHAGEQRLFELDPLIHPDARPGSIDRERRYQEPPPRACPRHTPRDRDAQRAPHSPSPPR
jgi:hypothetical protein